ncbi:MCP methyltransferase, CheR-type [Caldalkalibacillus thermarum TA2.A1]|uniref:protein-glutamate O-methyltransferase n=1 Tax=Caldalkalibacillus thermarum (strain TA2.A1) TaxID=986075 RepID=F5L725_CALTT|nr:protein-glutamate O-methyltransferase CheR [Caldalkalibacillus thermarum]EGL82860.1 MCP methyltransferase, CheR-type [Caldalkalibacillus thermarum TA2.A1]
MGDKDFEWFVKQFKQKTGVDLSLYKEPQMKRRLTTLRDKKGFDSFTRFFKAMEKDPQLVNDCLDRLTINVSEFFRNPNRWRVLEQKILPRLLQEGRPLKMWSAACSTGEEPYTLVMLLDQMLPAKKFQVLATDIDEVALSKARQGIYPARAVKEVPAPYLKTYFRQLNGLYYLSDEIKNRVLFKRQNLLSDPFGTGFDLIMCRNVMIYFTDEAKDLLYQKFSKALNQGGVLFVGSTEQIFHPEKYRFETEDTFFYRKI